jgi:transketolase
MSVVRPADANETAHAWKAVLEDTSGPAGLALSRQDLPTLEGTSAEGVARGGYVLVEASSGIPDVVLVGTGSEVQLAVEARKVLESEGLATRVVSMPCVEWFDRQDRSYRERVLPPSVRARVVVEAGTAQPWHRFAGDAGEIVSLERFGASADFKTLFSQFGITTEAVVEAARRSVRAARSR